MAEYHGSCLCGAVAWVIGGEIDDTSNCWCHMCQKQHGAAFAPYANIADSAFGITRGKDAVARYRSSPNVERTFCKVCGSNLTWQQDEHKDRIGVTLATFDTPYQGVVTRQLHIESRPGWLPGINEYLNSRES
ncbi:MAG TPA: GFA family protein [Telluria sp.]